MLPWQAIRLTPSFVLRGKAGTTGRAPLILPLIMILAALIALILVTAGLVIVQHRSDRGRAHPPAGNEATHRRSD
jgi:hypothetical protein